MSFWRLNESSGSVACDAQGVSSGTYQPGTTLGQPGPLSGDSATATGFDGTSGWVNVPDAGALHVGDTFTIEAWVKRARSGVGNEVIASKQSGSWVLMLGGSDQLTLRRSGVADVTSSTKTITDTQWHYVVATKSGATVHLYVDGSDVTGPVSNQTMADNTQPLAIGQSSDSAYLKGSIADVALYNVALTAPQIASHYSAGTGSSGSGGTGGGGNGGGGTGGGGTGGGGTGGGSSCSVSGSSYGQAVSTTSGVVSFWRLNESSGSVACDAQGVSSGTYQPGTTLGQPGPLSGDSATGTGFDGTAGWVKVPDASSLHVGDTFTIEAWVKRGRSGTGQNEVVASKQDGSWVLMFNGSDQLTLRRSTVGDVASSATQVTDTSRWHHVVATKSGTAVHLYLDGVDATGPVSNQTMVDNTQPLAIGQSTDGAYLKGTIADVALYKVALTAQQVTSHYNIGTGNSGSGGGGGSGSDPSIVAAGDIACSPSDPDFNGGNGDSAGCNELSTSNLMAGNTIGGNPIAAVLPLGDEQYDNGTLSEFNGSYGPSWGRVLGLSHPVPGNHEYYTSNASGYYDYFDGVGKSTGPAGDRTKGYYSYNIGTWHLIALNSNCSAIGGCGAGSPEEKWLQSDLSANTQAVCTLAYWHHPLFHSGTETGGDAMKQIFTDLYNANADVVLGGHEHQYERFAPQTPSGASNPSGGIREFIVGTGGRSLEGFGTTAANSEVRNSTTYGVLRLVLHPTSYDWRFIPAAGGSFADSGSTSCHTSH